MRGIRAVWLVAAFGIVGCGTSTTLPRVMRADPFEGVKMLKPGATATECRSTVLWRSAPSPEGDIGVRALERLLASDEEADAVVNARFAWTSWSVGVYGRRCVTVTGDVVRSIRTVRLPMPQSHGDHTGHHEP
jgi:hypothetical protein